MGVRFEGDGAVLAAGAQQDERRQQVDDGGDHRDAQAHPDLLQRLGMEESLHGGPADADGRDQDQ